MSSIRIKFHETVDQGARDEVVRALGARGFVAKPLFAASARPTLASIYTIAGADSKQLEAVKGALREYANLVQFAETSPERSLKAGGPAGLPRPAAKPRRVARRRRA